MTEPLSPRAHTVVLLGLKKRRREKKLILRGKGVHMYLVRWWLRSDQILG